MEEAASASATVLDIKAPVFAAHKPVTSDITLRPAGSFRQRRFEVYVMTTAGRGCRQRRLPREMWEIMGVSPVDSACTRCRVGFMMNTLHLLQVLVFATTFLASIPSGTVNETRVWKKQ